MLIPEFIELKEQARKIEFALACLHSALTAGDIRQIDYDVQYFGLCHSLAIINRDCVHLQVRESDGV